MILKHLSIENFGTLSNFSYDFTPGLTVLLRENGFGKSTFAAFIKAMFYGLQKDGNSLEKNERKRFEPWQGGKFGGSLDFSYRGTDYRVTRFFGKTPSKDTFSLWNLTERCQSTDFSEKLGEALFGLDAKSFARSTYLSQITEADPSATTSIRAKLSGLVEDTNDLNNFDTAMEQLRQERKKYRLYRGDGGLASDTMAKYRSLEESVAQAQGEKPQLEDLIARIEDHSRAFDRDEEALKEVREQISLASGLEKQRLLSKRREELEQKDREARQALSRLDAEHPLGYPTLEEVGKQKEQALALARLRDQLRALKEPEDRAVAEAENVFFGSPEKTEEELNRAQRLCTDLAKVNGERASLRNPREQARLKELEGKYPGGVPDREVLETLGNERDLLKTAQVQLDGITMEEGDRQTLSSLEALFALGVPSEAELRACEQTQEEIRSLGRERENSCLTPEEEERYQALRRTFAKGVPTEGEIRENRQSCRRIEALTELKNQKTDVVQDGGSQKPRLGLLIPGALCLILGAVLLALELTVPGAAAMALGAVLLVWGLLPGRKKTVVLRTEAISEGEYQELYTRQRQLSDFLLGFYPTQGDPNDQLTQLLIDRKEYLDLQEKNQLYVRKQQAIAASLREKTGQVNQLFARYYPGSGFDPGFVRSLREAAGTYARLSAQRDRLLVRRRELLGQMEAARRRVCEILSRYGLDDMDPETGAEVLEADRAEFLRLQEKQGQLLEKDRALSARARELEAQLRELLDSYGGWDREKSWEELLNDLRRRDSDFRQARQHLAQYQDTLADLTAQAEQAQKGLDAFGAHWQLEEVSRESLYNLEEDVRRRETLQKEQEQAQNALKKFREENPAAEEGEKARELPDMETLKQQEQTLQEDRDVREKELRRLRMDRDTLLRTVEQIPQWEDQMADLAEQSRQAEENSGLLDDTMAFLEKAKDRLANRYVDKVEQNFRIYADTLLEGQLEDILVDKDLTLRVNALGEPREAAAFSAGTEDCLMLCMRLAMVDALFEEEKPCLILDDPFVNLDDTHTEKALRILKEISKERQVIYLVCNTSRSIGTSL